MVWFQCEDCGDNLKKPKLPNHFRICSAFKLSCLDCGQVFGQQTVESHTQCITESEKYGPKGIGKAPNGTNIKSKSDAKQKPEVDINVGLSERPPWFCSLCSTKTTSKQTLLLHAEGKKHRTKARGFHASKQQATDTEVAKDFTEKNQKSENVDTDGLVKSAGQNEFKPESLQDGVEVENLGSQSKKKRKCNGPEQVDIKQKKRCNILSELNDSEVDLINKPEIEETKGQKKAKSVMNEEDAILDSTLEKKSLKKKVKWKKLITSALKSNSDGVLKLKKLKKLVLKSLVESGFPDDENKAYEILERKINSSSRFTLNGKYVFLVSSS